MNFFSLKFSTSIKWALLLTALLMPIRAESADPPMQIKYIYYSGVLPRGVERHECDLDSQTMPAADVAELEMLVEKSKILDKSTEKDFEQTDGGPGYIIDYRRGTSAAKVTWSYNHAPQRIWPLVKFLEKRSRIRKT